MSMLPLAWRNLWRHPRRTWLTGAAIAFSTTLLVFMITLQLGAYDMLIENNLRMFIGQMQVQRDGYLDKPQMRLTVSNARTLAERLARDGGMPAVAVRAHGFALAASEARSYGVPVVGVEPDKEPAVSAIPGLIKHGRYLSTADAQEVVVGSALARNLKIAVGDELALLGSARDGSGVATVVQVVGVFETGIADIDRQLVQMPLPSFQDAFAMGEEAHTLVMAGLALEHIPEAKARVKALLPAEAGLVVRDWQELIPGLQQLIQVDMVQNWFLYISLIVIVTFSILNTFLMSVLERTREFGILLALGASPLRVGSMVMLESGLLTALGLAAGMAVGGGLALYFYIHGFTFPGLKEVHAQFGGTGVVTPKLSPVTLTLGPAIILLATLCASLYPVLRIRRLEPVEAIRAA